MEHKAKISANLSSAVTNKILINKMAEFGISILFQYVLAKFKILFLGLEKFWQNYILEFCIYWQNSILS